MKAGDLMIEGPRRLGDGTMILLVVLGSAVLLSAMLWVVENSVPGVLPIPWWSGAILVLVGFGTPSLRFLFR